MRIDILTLFPEMFTGFLDGSLLGAARASGLLDVRVTNIRDFAEGAHRQVDDRPFGGGPGMLLMPGPVVDCVESVQREAAGPGHLVMLTPGGRRLDQSVVEELRAMLDSNNAADHPGHRIDWRIAPLPVIVGDENMVNPLDALKERSQNSDLRAMLDSLEPREAEIIRLRFGFDGYDEMTLEEVGKKFKVTRERIRQLQNIALSKIRKAIAKNEAQRSADEIELDERQRKRMEVIKEFIESKSTVPASAADRN